MSGGNIYVNNNIYHPDDSIYAKDGTLTDDRVIDADGNSFSIDNASQVGLSGTVNLADAPTTDNTETQILVRDPVSGDIEVREAGTLGGDTLYTANGTITDPTRTVDLDGNNLTFSNANRINLSGTVRLTDPPVVTTSTDTLVYNSITGRIEQRDDSGSSRLGYIGTSFSGIGSPYVSGSNVIIGYQDSTQYDVGGDYAVDTYTAPEDGLYYVHADARIQLLGAPTNFPITAELTVLVDGATSANNGNIYFHGVGAGIIPVQTDGVRYLLAGQTVQIEFNCTHGGTNSGAQSYFQIIKL
jgi:hypothetical protein